MFIYRFATFMIFIIFCITLPHFFLHLIFFQFRTQLKIWYSYGTWPIPSWLIRKSSCRNSTYRTTTRLTARSNTQPETSRAYRLSSICAGDWVITCSTRTSRPPWSSSCPGSPSGSSRKPSQRGSLLAWRHYWPSVRRPPPIPREITIHDICDHDGVLCRGLNDSINII